MEETPIHIAILGPARHKSHESLVADSLFRAHVLTNIRPLHELASKATAAGKGTMWNIQIIGEPLLYLPSLSSWCLTRKLQVPPKQGTPLDQGLPQVNWLAHLHKKAPHIQGYPFGAMTKYGPTSGNQRVKSPIRFERK